MRKTRKKREHMTTDVHEKMTVDNAVNIAKLIEVSTRTSEDVEKIIKHLEESAPMSDNIKKLTQDVHDFHRKFDVLRPVFTVLRYPKAAILSAIGLYFLAISDVREGAASIIVSILG